MVMSQNEDRTAAQSNWLGWLEGASVVGSIGGSIATALGQPAAFAVLPLSLAAALNLASRLKLQQSATALAGTDEVLMLQLHNATTKSEMALDDLHKALSGTDEVLMIQLNNTNNRTEGAIEVSQSLQRKLDTLQAQVNNIAQEQSALIESTLEESYYRRGIELDKRGEHKDAIAAYNEALRINPNYADAHLQLGVACAHRGQKQQAIASLRTATKLFFDGGELERYHEARALSEQVHSGQLDIKAVPVEPTPETISTNDTPPEGNLAVNRLFV
jgi:tetratricopeptide (TPR) repeat protein